MKKIISLLLCIILTFSCTISVGAYSFSNNGTATIKATAYRLPSANSGDVWWIDANDKLQVFCKDGDYYLVLYPFNNTGKHVLGYVTTSAVKASGVPNASSFYKNEKVRTKANANLYHNPSTDKLTGASGSNQTVRTAVSKGQELTLLFEKDGFYCVRTSNDTGFIEKNKICNHSSVSNKEFSSTAININDKTYHEVKIGYNEVCDDCGLVTKKNASKSEKEKHSLSENICTDCGWFAPVTEKEECKHSNTTKHMSEEKETIYTQKDDTHHSVTTYYHLYCTDCYTYTEKNLSEKYNEEHNFSGEKCIICGFVKDSGKAAWVCNTKGEKLKIHRVAALGNTIRGEIPEGAKFTVFGDKTNGFYRAEYNGTVGYVQAEYVTFTEPKKESEEIMKKTAYVYNTSGKILNIRSKADKTSAVVITMAEGSSVTVTGDAINGFYPVECEGKSGYAQADYITFKKETNGKTAWISYAVTSDLDIHRLPAIGKTIRGKIPAGAQLTVFGEKTNGFYRVEYNGISGYVQAKCITFSKPPEGKTAWVYNRVEPLKIHRSAALGNTIRGEIPIGDSFIVTGERTNGFYPVYYNGISGFAESKYVTYDKSKAAMATGYVWPVSGGYHITVLDYYYGSAKSNLSGIGPAHPVKGGKGIQGAIDIAATGNVLSTSSGTVISINKGHSGGWGNNITIRHNDGTYSFYAHLANNSICVAKNQKVVAGQKIGVVGNTGNSYGNHLHFEIWNSSGKTIYTINVFKEKYRKNLTFDSDIVSGGSNNKDLINWIKNNYKLSGKIYVAK